MACPYARSIELDSDLLVSSSPMQSNDDALVEILSLSSYAPPSSVKPDLKRLPSSDELVNYGNYLQLNKVLDSQTLLSAKHDLNKQAVHDEHLFIIIHQSRQRTRTTYFRLSYVCVCIIDFLGFELWFKQIIWEIDSLRAIFGSAIIDETHMFVSINRLQRCVQIWQLLCNQISILETMTPLDFMEFRAYLSPASGFQSLQFRLIENKLGLMEKARVLYNQLSYKNAFPSSREQTELINSLEEPTLLMLIEVRSCLDGICRLLPSF
jgi:tryptophan 2,3-dioxygenase